MRILYVGTIAAALAGAACTRTVYVTPSQPPPPAPAPAPAPAPTPVRERPQPVLVFDIPRGHLPEVGECRLWIPGDPPGQQPRPRSRSCAGLARTAPAGTWILYRPTDRRFVHVRLVDERMPGVVVVARVFEYASGRFVRYERVEPEHIAQADPRRQPDPRPRPEVRPRPDERPAPTVTPTPPPHTTPLPNRPDSPREAGNAPLPKPGPEVRPQPHPAPAPQPSPAPAPQPNPAPRPDGHPALDIPPGHLPEPGECRVWIPGVPPGRQRHLPSGDCATVTREAPAGTWVVYRPTRDRHLVHVRVVDERRPGVVLVVRVFEAESGRYVRDEALASDDRASSTGAMPPLSSPFRPEPRRPAPAPVEPPQPADEQPQPTEEAPKPRDDQPRPQDERPRDEQPRPKEEKPHDEQPRPQDNTPRAEPDRFDNRRGGREDRGKPDGNATLDVTAREFPGPGTCRVWLPGAPRGHQRHEASADCDAITKAAPAGTWVLYRPADDPAVLHVRVVDERQSGVIVSVRIYDAATGRLRSEQRP